MSTTRPSARPALLGFARSRAVLALALAGLAGLSGCEVSEHYSYASDPYAPKTVTVIDLATREQLLTVDVPVGQQLNIKFDRAPGEAEKAGQDRMRWALRPLGDSDVNDGKGNAIDVPPPSLRRIDVTLRAAPELPPESASRPAGSR